MRSYFKLVAVPVVVSLTTFAAACTSLIGVNDLQVRPTFTDVDGRTPGSDTGPGVDGNLPPPDALCSDCPNAGATKCAGGQVQTCRQTGACLVWSAAETCAQTSDGVDQVCCGGDAG